MAEVHGTCTPQFAKLRELMKQFIDSGDEIGTSLSVNINGEEVVNLYGGYADAAKTRPWTEDTIVGIASSTKMFSALAVLMLVDSGEISVTDKVSKYWPEFGANGKENVEIRHLLSHTSGVPGWDDPMTIGEMCSTAFAAPKLAAQAPWFEPGSASAYHAWTYGHLLGGVVQRVTGSSLKQFLVVKIARALGADIQLGAPESDIPRIADSVPTPSTGPPADFTPGPLFMKAICNPMPTPDTGKSIAWRTGENGSSNGYSNAHAMTTILSAITLAGKGDNRLLSEKTVDLIFEEQSNGTDLAIGKPIRFGIGYAIKGDGDWVSSWLPDGKIAYWGGSGGSLSIMDVGRGVTIAYAMNKRANELIGNTASRAYVAAIYEALGVKI
ncbi:beta-lactamase [Xylariaceae sp. FL0255]|nr:beta-lactamase [Xylariaceae sp. FL0255]